MAINDVKVESSHESKTPSPETIRSLKATILFWQNIESEFDFLTGEDVSEKLGTSDNLNVIENLRQNGKLLAVSKDDEFLYPCFQFKGDMVYPVIAELVKLGLKYDMASEDIVAWLCQPTTYIRGISRRPVDHLDNFDLVLNTASSAWGVIW